MSRNFSFKTFFRSVSADLLHQYFASQHLLADFDWTQDNALLADTLYTQIQRLPDSHAAFVEQDFALISELATESFVLELHDVARSLYNDADPIIDAMVQQPGLLNQVF
ncbi:MAG: hypothetical protein GX298_04605, partial [Planctomycetes bacterium]|jgi:hypothetical protein|nr:hypothetical protein [Planctomycetota bacterium]